ncbi:DUF3472 domain-containing protein [Nonomuraea endophytica]|uniref:DUF3472 domain-containing protein n=1 Tax=Nonomuraea endophytica TaxID=714136 RepID=UPI0037C76EC1
MSRRRIACALLLLITTLVGIQTPASGAAAAQNIQHQNGMMGAVWTWPGNGFWNVDQQIRIEEKAHRRFWAQQVWWTGTNVTAYLGLQTEGNRFDGSVGDMAIFSAWNANASRGPSCATFNQGGPGHSCRVPLLIKAGTVYRLRIWRQEADSGGQWWGVWVKNESTGVDKHVGGIRLPATYTSIATAHNFIDYFGAKVGCAEVGRSTAVFARPAANSRGGTTYDFAATYSNSTTGTCVTGSAAAAPIGTIPGVRVVHGGRISTNTRVVLVHGFERDGGNSCNGTWGDFIDAMRDMGWTNTLVVSRYYADDTSCDNTARREPLASVNIGSYGSHDEWYPSGHVERDGVIVGHSTDARIRHLAYHWAWMVYERYTRDLHPIKAVGHSMGGLIIRAAIKEVQAGNPVFPPRLIVEDVVTLGTPHSGAGFANSCALTHEQCRDLRPDSDFLNDLAANGKNPQGDGRTEWTAIGSHDDDLVTPGSATNMSALEEIQYGDIGIEHSDYMHSKLGSHLLDFDARAGIRHYDRECGQFSTYFWPVTATHLGLGNLVDDDC